jgi:hypothetical protein
VEAVAGAITGWQERCPSCGEPIQGERTFSPWCDQCDWNLDPRAEATTRASRLDAIYDTAARGEDTLFRG